MLIEEVKKYLEQLSIQELKLEQNLQILEHYEIMIQRIKNQFDRTEKSESIKQIESQFSLIENSVNELFMEVENTRVEMTKQIQKMDDQFFVKILYQKYIQHQSIENIAKKWGIQLIMCIGTMLKH